jgi:hypothetical protein
MNKIKGISIPHLGFDPLKQGDFLYHEGPLLSHFIDRNNPSDNYFYRWVDFDDTVNRWLIFRLSEEDLLLFFNKKNALRDLIKQNAFVHILDLDKDLNRVQILLVSINDLPNEYLPSQNAFFDENQYENHALYVRNNLLNKKGEIQDFYSLLSKEIAQLKEQQSKTYSLLETLSGLRLNP